MNDPGAIQTSRILTFPKIILCNKSIIYQIMNKYKNQTIKAFQRNIGLVRRVPTAIHYLPLCFVAELRIKNLKE
jgi:hypothetical protein